MCKLHLLLVFLLLSWVTIPGYGQKSDDRFFMLDEKFEGTKRKDVPYFLRIQKLGDSSYQWDIYHAGGPLVSSETYKDFDGTLLHGPSFYYKTSGALDSMCHFENGRLQGDVFCFDQKGKLVSESKYKNGERFFYKDHLNDSLGKGKSAEAKPKVDTLKGADFSKVEVESDFEGGISAWAKYLTKNLDYPGRALKLQMQGMVMVQFVVDKEGAIFDPRISRSVEYSLDEEALRIIRKAPRWTPAIQEGRKVKSYKRQPIIFKLQ